MTSMCGDTRFEVIEKAKEALLKESNIESSPKEMEVLENFLFRAWQMGWLNQYDIPTDYKERMKEEFLTLNEREEELQKFFDEKKDEELNLPQSEVVDLRCQLYAMQAYRDTLLRRCMRNGVKLPYYPDADEFRPSGY